MITSEKKLALKTYKENIGDSLKFRVNPDPEMGTGFFFMDSRSPEFPRLLEFLLEKNGKLKASFLVSISREGLAVSLPFAPFGGIWTSEKVKSDALETFITQILEFLRVQGVKSIQIIQPPKPYVPQSDLIHNLLLKSGFELRNMLSHQFFIGRKKIKKLVQEQASRIHKKENESQVKIKTGAIQNFGFLEDIRSWNSKRGYEVTFDEKRLITQVSEFPENYFLISVIQADQAIAHSLAVKLTKSSLYYYLSAADPKSKVKNLGDSLVNALFSLAMEQKIDLIDLGSSETNQQINHSLMYFKSRFSNDISNKISWYRKIEE